MAGKEESEAAGEGAVMVNQDDNGNFVELYNKVS